MDNKTGAADGPLITVVTVVYNAGQYIEATINSVTSQSYANISYLVIDGGSTDASVDIIKKYSGQIDYWVSEPDNGIYDAMNKGVLQASPGYMVFMNAGDEFFASDTLEKIATKIGNRRPAVLYGHNQVHYDDGYHRLDLSRDLRQLYRGMCFSHQAMLVDASLMRENLYNIENPIGADFEFICQVYTRGVEFMQIDLAVAKTTAGGVSDESRTASIRSHWRVARKYWPGLKTDAYYLAKTLDSFLRMSLRRVLPRRWINKLVRFKYQ